MKRITFAIVALVWAGVGLCSPAAQAARVSTEIFYDALDPYGEWMEAPDYGYVWHPRDVDDNWRPYTVGSWAYTEAGWTWVSEEPFGWATYHYGRWVDLERTGWVWVPDNTWGPAWVSWRRSDRNIGWAPLPPEARFEARVGFSGWVDSYYDIGPSSYSFVRVSDLGAPRLREVIVERRQNITIVNETRNITNITYVNNQVYNEGPQYDVVVRQSSQPIRRLRLERRTDVDFRSDRDGRDRGDRFSAQISGDALRIVAPEVDDRRDLRPAKVGRKIDRLEVNRGWRDAGDARQVQELRAKVASEAKPPAELPQKAQLRGTAATAETARPTAETPRPATETAPPAAPTTAEKPKRDRNRAPEATAPAVAGQEPSRPTKSTEVKRGETAETPAPAAPRTAEAPPVRKETRPTADAPPKQDPTATVTPDQPVREGNPAADRRGRGQAKTNPEAREARPPAAPTTEPAAAQERPPRTEDPRRHGPSEQPQQNRQERPLTEKPPTLDPAPRPSRPERPAPPEAAKPNPDQERPNAAAERPRREGPPAGEPRRPEAARPELPPKPQIDHQPAAGNQPPADGAVPHKGPPKGKGDKDKGDKDPNDKKE